jgi:hypothetical protein
MSKWDKYRIQESKPVPTVNRWEKYRIQPQKQEKSLGQSINEYADVAGKSFNRGALGLLDLPQLAATGVEELGNLIPGGTPTHYASSVTPVSERVSNLANKVGYQGFNKPKTDTLGKRLVSGAFEGAGSALGGVGIGTAGAKVGMPFFSRFLGSPQEAGKLARMGAGLGTTGAGLEETGFDPLTANLAPAIAGPLVGATGKNILNKFSKEHKNLKTKQKVAGALKSQIGELNLPGVLENIQKHKKQKNPINLQLTTPEIAQDVGLSRLYRTQSNFPSLPQRYAENDAKLLEALESIGTTGLPESVKGEAIRTPFFEKFNKKKTRRERLTSDLYKNLESIQEGLEPSTAKTLLKEEIGVSGPSNKSALEKFYKGLNRNEIDPASLEKAKELRATIRNIDREYKDLSPSAREQLKAPLLEELNQIESSVLPRPIQIENTIQELGDKVNALSRSGEANAARKYGGIKKALETDLAKSPVGLKHREEYKRLSKPLNEIETSNLLHNFVKKNKDVSQLEGFVAPSEKIPSLILGSDLPNTKILMNKAKGNKETLDLIKGTYIDKLLETSKLNSGNFSYDKANKFLGNKYNKERIDLIFNSKERKKIDQFLDTLQKRNRLESMGKVSGSDTHQKLKVENEFNESLGGLGKIAGKVAAKASGTGGIGEAILNKGVSKFNELKNQRYNSILEEALLDPNAFKKLMTNKHQVKGFGDFYNPIPSLITGANLGNGER